MHIFDILNNDTAILLYEMERNQTLKKLVQNKEDDPLGRPLKTEKMIYRELQPYPFSPESVSSFDGVILRVYIESGKFDGSMTMTDIPILFDIIVPVSMWTINAPRPTDGVMSKQIRAFSIAREIMNTFEAESKTPEQSKSTLGILKFTDFVQLPVNENYHGVRLVAEAFGIHEKNER